MKRTYKTVLNCPGCGDKVIVTDRTKADQHETQDMADHDDYFCGECCDQAKENAR